MRWLHARGVPLWDAAWEEEVEGSTIRALPCGRCKFYHCAGKKIIAVPRKPKHASHVFEALWYGWFRGAAMTPALAETFKARRRAMRAALCCFHVAARLSQGRGRWIRRLHWQAWWLFTLS